jgi:hypothetical protein
MTSWTLAPCGSTMAMRFSAVKNLLRDGQRHYIIRQFALAGYSPLWLRHSAGPATNTHALSRISTTSSLFTGVSGTSLEQEALIVSPTSDKADPPEITAALREAARERCAKRELKPPVKGAQGAAAKRRTLDRTHQAPVTLVLKTGC